MHVWHGGLHCPGHIDVVVAIELGVDPTLEANLSCPHGLGLHRSLGDVVERQEIRSTPQVEREWALRESTEFALERAHICVVDVAI